VSAIVDKIKSEPALVAGIVQAVVALAVAFGLPLTDAQQGTILALSAAILALFVRQRVTPTE
jgi:uncharacterized membrane protein (UPF0136 family)